MAQNEPEVFPAPGDQQGFIQERFPGTPVPYNTKKSSGKAGRGVRTETSAGEWISQIVMCERAYQNSFVNARNNLRHYENKKYGARITVPLLTPMIEIKSAVSTFRNPHIFVRPRKKAVPTTPEEVLASAVKETYANFLWQHLDLKREVRRITRDALLLTGRGIGTPGYNMIIDPQEVINYDSVVMYRTSPFDYYLDIEADSSSNAFYGIRRMIMPIWLAEQRFGKKGIFQEVRYSRWARFKPMEREVKWNMLRKFARTVVYEIQDLTTNKFYFVTPTYGEFLEKFENPYPIDGLVAEFMEPMPIPDEIFCMSEAGLIRPQLDELTTLRNYWMELWRREIPKYITNRGAASQDELEKLISADSVSVTEMTDIEGIKLLETVRTSPGVQYHEERVRQDISEITGWNQYLQGSGGSKTRKTAYEVREIMAGSNIRIADLNDHVEQFCAKVARKMLAIAAEFVGPQEIQQIVGLPTDLMQMGLPNGFDISQEIMDDSEVTIHAGSMQLPSKEQDMQKAMLLQSFLAYPETKRFAALTEMARLLDINPQQLFKQPSQVAAEQQEEQRVMQMTGGKGRQMGGAQTGGVMGSRSRQDLMTPTMQ